MIYRKGCMRTTSYLNNIQMRTFHKTWIFLILLSTVQSTVGQSKQTDANIVGDVQCEGRHLPFINIAIEGTTIGTNSDGTGHFQMVNLPEGTHTVVASGVGYKSASQQVEVKKNTTIEIKFDLQEDVLNLETVVVTANRTQANRAEAPLLVHSITPKIFSLTQSVNVAEGLCFTPGLRTETNCQNCGFTQLRMNGLEGPYTQILMNSRPVFSGLAGVYGLELIPANMIERLEVVRGGGSALFGGNAIAGTVNIITKEPVRNSFMVEGRTTFIGMGNKNGGNPAFDGQSSMNTSLVTDDGKTGGYLYTMLRNRDAYDANDDGFTELVKMENTTFGFNVFHKPGAKSKISLDGYRISEFRRGGNKLSGLPHEADIAEQLDHLITGGNLSYNKFINGNYDKFTLYVSAQDVKRESYYGAQQDPNAYGHTKNTTSSAGGHYTVNADRFIFAPSSTIFGIDNTNDYMHDTKLGTNDNGNTTLTKQFVNTLGGFVQHDWKGNKVNFSLGLRYDNYWINDLADEAQGEDLQNGVLVPRVSVLYKARPSLRLRVGYAKGYRAPQVFNEDLHIELVNAQKVRTINSEDLEQENSHSLTSSVDFDFSLHNTKNNLLIEGFYTMLENPFADEFYELNDQGDFAYLRVNSDNGAYVSGLNMEFNSFITRKLETQVGFTLQTSRYKEAVPWGDEESSYSKNFMRTPDSYGYATFNWKPVNQMNVNLSFNYTGSMYVPHLGLYANDFEDETEQQAVAQAIANGDIIEGEDLFKSNDFLVTDLLFTYDFKLTNESTLQFFAGAKNIFNQVQTDFDRGIYRDAAFIYGPSSFRSFNIGLKLGNF
jgi:outer membrane receptor for ferrienterochelin and colicins